MNPADLRILIKRFQYAEFSIGELLYLDQLDAIYMIIRGRFQVLHFDPARFVNNPATAAIWDTRGFPGLIEGQHYEHLDSLDSRKERCLFGNPYLLTSRRQETGLALRVVTPTMCVRITPELLKLFSAPVKAGLEEQFCEMIDDYRKHGMFSWESRWEKQTLTSTTSRHHDLGRHQDAGSFRHLDDASRVSSLQEARKHSLASASALKAPPLPHTPLTESSLLKSTGELSTMASSVSNG
jgi:hypothetical protein